jgi:hypothetical protein
MQIQTDNIGGKRIKRIRLPPHKSVCIGLLIDGYRDIRTNGSAKSTRTAFIVVSHLRKVISSGI